MTDSAVNNGNATGNAHRDMRQHVHCRRSLPSHRRRSLPLFLPFSLKNFRIFAQCAGARFACHGFFSDVKSSDSRLRAASLKLKRRFDGDKIQNQVTLRGIAQVQSIIFPVGGRLQDTLLGHAE
jgi:hypothetical protein